MAQLKDLTGKKFGKLTVVGISSYRRGTGIFFDCICDCGNTKTRRGSELTGRRAFSCGCWSKPRDNIDRSEAFLRNKYSSIKSISKKEGVVDVLSFEAFEKMSYGKCFYCKEFPAPREVDDPGVKGQRITVKCHGIDRTSVLHGYTQKNSVACCARCNVSKMDSNIPTYFKRISDTINNLNLTWNSLLKFDAIDQLIEGEIVKPFRKDGHIKRFN